MLESERPAQGAASWSRHRLPGNQIPLHREGHVKPKKRISLLRELQQDQWARIRGDHGMVTSGRELVEDEALLVRAERHVRRRIRLRKSHPLNLLLLLPGLLFIGTRSRLVLTLLVATYPVLFVLRALLARFFSALIGPEEILVRREYERLRNGQQDG